MNNSLPTPPAQGNVSFVLRRVNDTVLEDRPVRPLRAGEVRVGGRSFACAAHQAAAQQVETGVPPAFELFLLLDALEVFFFPALSFVGHAKVRR